MGKLLTYVIVIVLILLGIPYFFFCIDWLTDVSKTKGSPNQLEKEEIVETDLGYSITYNLEDGTLTAENPSYYTLFSETFTLNNPTKEGYEFLGWTGSNGENPQLKITICKGSAGDLEFTANYIPVYEETILYLDNSTNKLIWNCDEHFTNFKLYVNNELVKELNSIYEISLSEIADYFNNGNNYIYLESIAEDIVYISGEIIYIYYLDDYSINYEFNMTLNKTDRGYKLISSNDTYVEYDFQGNFIDSSGYSGSGDFDETTYFKNISRNFDYVYFAKPITLSVLDLLKIFVKDANSSILMFDLSDEFYCLPKTTTGNIGKLPKCQVVYKITYTFTATDDDKQFSLLPNIPEPDFEPDIEPSIEFDENSTLLYLHKISNYNTINAVFTSNGGSLTIGLLMNDGNVLYIKYTTDILTGETIEGWTYNPYTESTAIIEDIQAYSQSVRLRIIDEFYYSISSNFWNYEDNYPTALHYMFSQIYNLRIIEANRLGVDILSDFEYLGWIDCGLSPNMFIVMGTEGDCGINAKFTSSAN